MTPSAQSLSSSYLPSAEHGGIVIAGAPRLSAVQVPLARVGGAGRSVAALSGRTSHAAIGLQETNGTFAAHAQPTGNPPLALATP